MLIDKKLGSVYPVMASRVPALAPGAAAAGAPIRRPVGGKPRELLRRPRGGGVCECVCVA